MRELAPHATLFGVLLWAACASPSPSRNGEAGAGGQPSAALATSGCSSSSSSSSSSTDAAASTGSGSGGGLAGQPPASALYGPSYRKLVFEIDYAEGAEPYVGPSLRGGDAFDIFETNVRALFPGDKELVLPRKLEAMGRLDDVPEGPYSGKKILGIAALHRDEPPSDGDSASFYFVWLDGFYDDGEDVRTDVLGVSLGASGVVAMFKPVIEAAGGGLLLETSRLVEQATLVHEFGHAAGLVNNGLPMASPHHDAEHGAHCTNAECVMYYAIESVPDVVDFVSKTLTDEDAVLFGPECLGDAELAGRSGP